MRFDARKAFLRFIQYAPRLLDRHIESLVADDVPAAKEVVVLNAVSFQFALHDAQGVRVIVDTGDNGRLIIDVDPVARAHAFDGAPDAVNPLKTAVNILNVVAVFVLREKLVRVIKMNHYPKIGFRIGLMKPVKH